jgi:hypothetical protein
MRNFDYTALFHQVAAAQAELRLFNLYQGIPIATPASLVAVSAESICLRTEKHQVVCLYLERETYLHSPQFPATIKAKVRALDIPHLEAFLTGFEPVKARIGARAQVRVHPKDTIPGDLRDQISPEILHGELADISGEGLAVYLPRKTYLPSLHTVGAEVSVSFHLPGSYELPGGPGDRVTAKTVDPLARFDRANLRLLPIPGPAASGAPERLSRSARVGSPRLNVRAVIANLVAENDAGRVRLGLRIQPGDASRPIIAQFIASRQSEILRELREITQLLSS